MKNLAVKYHKGQYRKSNDNTRIPYIVHPQAVAETLLVWGEPADSPAISVAWGHDLLEDTKVTDAEIIAVSDENVLACIKQLTHRKDVDKSLYLQYIANSRDRIALLVKLADRLCNSRDFVQLNGALYAYQYLHSADCLIPALEELRDDPVVQQALKAWHDFEESISDKAHLDAIRGSLLGGAVGDALGAPVEFMSKAEINAAYGKKGVQDYVEFSDGTGAITDDTQMTLFTAEGLLRANTRHHSKGLCCAEGVVHYAYLRWLKTQGITVGCAPEELNSGWLIKEKQLYTRRAPGNTCISALRDNASSNKADNNSKGCGTVMRMAPVGLFLAPELAYESGCKFSVITHGHPTGVTAGGAFALLISHLYYGKSLEQSLDLTERHLEQFPEAKETLDAIRKARRAKDITELGEGWVAEEALAIGIYCALKHTRDFKAGVLEAVNITGDSDSTGSIAGNILGALNGENAIPAEWRNKLREYSIVSKMADDLHRRCELDHNGEPTGKWWDKYPGF